MGYEVNFGRIKLGSSRPAQSKAAAMANVGARCLKPVSRARLALIIAFLRLSRIQRLEFPALPARRRVALDLIDWRRQTGSLIAPGGALAYGEL